MNTYLGIDLGGSKIEYGVLTPKGFTLSGREKTPLSPQEIIISLKSIISEFKEEKIGVGFAGLVDRNKGEIFFSPNLPFKKFKLQFELSRLTKKKIAIENDVNCFTLAQHFLKSQKPANFIGITLGTGIGGGLILNGKQYRGKGFAGEIGHMCILADGPDCHCGGKGCLEALASGWALEREGEKIAGRKISAEKMAEKALNKEDKYVQIFRKMGYYLGIGLANLVNLFSPDEIVIGGSLINSKKLFWKMMMATLKKQSFPEIPLKVKVSAAKKTKGLVALGAALVAKGSSDE